MTILCERCKREVECGEVSNPGAAADLDLSTLLYVGIDEYMHLPNCGGVYFALGENRICYVGESGTLGARWRHHPYLERLQLEMNARIAWIQINDTEVRRKFEKDCIRRFRPLWNRGGSEHVSGSIKAFVRFERTRHFAAAHTSHALNHFPINRSSYLSL